MLQNLYLRRRTVAQHCINSDSQGRMAKFDPSYISIIVYFRFNNVKGEEVGLVAYLTACVLVIFG